jgi:hypothetical protein
MFLGRKRPHAKPSIGFQKSFFWGPRLVIERKLRQGQKSIKGFGVNGNFRRLNGIVRQLNQYGLQEILPVKQLISINWRF